jgi:hypothetical protein
LWGRWGGDGAAALRRAAAGCRPWSKGIGAPCAEERRRGVVPRKDSKGNGSMGRGACCCAMGEGAELPAATVRKKERQKESGG